MDAILSLYGGPDETEDDEEQEKVGEKRGRDGGDGEVEKESPAKKVRKKGKEEVAEQHALLLNQLKLCSTPSDLDRFPQLKQRLDALQNSLDDFFRSTADPQTHQESSSSSSTSSSSSSKIPVEWMFPERSDYEVRETLAGWMKWAVEIEYGELQGSKRGQTPEMFVFGSSASDIFVRGSDLDLNFHFPSTSEVPDVLDPIKRDAMLFRAIENAASRVPSVIFKTPLSKTKVDISRIDFPVPSSSTDPAQDIRNLILRSVSSFPMYSGQIGRFTKVRLDREEELDFLDDQQNQVFAVSEGGSLPQTVMIQMEITQQSGADAAHLKDVQRWTVKHLEMRKENKNLIRVVKLWSLSRSINSSFNGSLPSLAYLVMFFTVSDAIAEAMNERSEENSKSSGAFILLKFFQRFSDLSKTPPKTCIRTEDSVGRKIYRNDFDVIRFVEGLHDPGCRGFGETMFVEDPFLPSVNVARFVDWFSIDRLRSEFQRATRICLRKSPSFSSSPLSRILDLLRPPS